MSQQIQITGGAKVRDLNDVIIGTNGVLSSLAFNVANGVPKLDSNGKILVSQLPNSVMEYLGTWNAATNTPTLANGVGNQGDVYLCNVAGTVNFGAGPITFAVGDTAIYSGSIWQKAGGATGTVTSVGLSTSGNAFTIGSSPVTTSGTITINGAGTASQYINGAGNLTTFPTLITSIGLSMPSAFNVSNSPLTANGTISVTGAGTVSQYIDGTGALQSFPSLTGYVPYVGATTDVDLGVHVLNAQALHVKGTAGAGHLGLKHQTATPTGSANESLVFANVDGDLGWQNGNLYSTILNTHSNTANRVYTFPNASGTLALTTDINYPVTSVFGRTGAVTAQSGDYNTTLVTEGTNLYYTDARARGALSFVAGSGAYNSTTGVITIPTNNNQITNGANYITLTSLSFAAGSGAYNNTTGVITIPTNNNQITNGANYITLTSLSATTPLSYNNTTGAFSISQASTTVSGYLSSTDFTTFSNKQSALTFSSPLVNTSGTISIPAATSLVNGYLTSTDWTTFNNKQAAITLTTTGSSGSATFISNTLNVPTYTLSGLGGQPLATNLTSLSGLTYVSASFVKMTAAGTFTLDTNTYYLASNPNSYIALTALSASSPLSYNNTTGAFTISQATTSTNGYLSSTDFNTFNNKQGTITLTTTGTSGAATFVGNTLNIPQYQSVLTNPITGTGTTNYLSKFTGSTTIGNSLIWDNGTNVGIGNTNTSYTLDVTGTGRFSGAVQMGNSSQVMGGGILKLGIASGNAGAALQLLGWSSFPNWQIDTAVISGNYLAFTPSTTNGGSTFTTPVFQLTPAGAATFSSSVTAGSSVYAPNYITDPTTGNATTNGTVYALNGASSNNSYGIGIGAIRNSAYDMWFQTGAINGGGYRWYIGTTEKMTMSSSGNVGIGTTSPSAAITSYSTTQSNQFKAAGTSPGITFSDAVSSVTYGGAVGVATAANNFITGAAAGDMAITNQSATAGAIIFGIGTTEKFRIASTGAATFSSSVTAGDFISTSGTGAILRLLGGGTSVQYQKWANDGGNYFIGISSSTGTGLLGGQNAYSFCLVTESARDMSFGTTNTTRMTITSAGSVGIGTSSPSSILQVVGGDIYLGSYHAQSKLALGADTNHYVRYNSSLDGAEVSGYSGVMFSTVGGTERMRITSGGTVGINGSDTGIQLYIKSQSATSSTYIIYGQNSTPTTQFYVRSDAYGYLNDTAWHYGSDLRMKENISDVTNGLSIVSELKPKHFDYIDGAKNRIGFIAQDVQEILPNLVSVSNEETGMLALQTDALIPYLVKAIQEQNQLIKDLKSRLDKAGL